MEFPVLCFGRDQTIDTNPPVEGLAIPLYWVQYYAHYTDHHVWATGNQQLQIEAGIPTPYEAREILIQKGHPISSPPGGGENYRYDRLNIIHRLYNEIFESPSFVVVDNSDLVNIGNMKQWKHYEPEKFLRGVEDETIDLPRPEESIADGEPYQNTNKYGTYDEILGRIDRMLHEAE